MIKARVSTYLRHSRHGRTYRVRSHIRGVKNRGGHYNIEEERQLPYKNSNREIDAELHALPPGKRTSRSGQTYYERRFNRSDEGDWI